ncbi:MAG: S41 family peptidase [Phycisphaerales bacterium]
MSSMWVRRVCPCVAAAVILIAGVRCASIRPPSGTPITREQARASFEAAWSTIEKGDPDPAHGGVDWRAVHDRFAPSAEACTTRESLRAVLQQMLSTLGRSHFGILSDQESDRLADAPDATAADGTCGLDLRLIESQAIVTGVQDGSPAASAGVRRGWRVTLVDDEPPIDPAWGDETGNPLKRYAHNASIRALDHGAAGVATRWSFVDAAGAPRAISIARESLPGQRTKLGLLPEFSVTCTDRLLTTDELRALGAPEDLRIGVIAFNVWMPVLAAELDAAVDRLRDSDGIVLDLRGNPGGVGAMAMGVAGHFSNEPDSLGTMRTRDTTLEFRINPRRSTADGREVEPFAGPLAILVDPLSASTSEIFAGGLQALGRARVFGRTSAGAALPAQMRRLPSGDGMMFAFADFTLPNGRSLEGEGVIPDEPSGDTLDAWREGHDPDLRAAAQWISRTLRDRDCHE